MYTSWRPTNGKICRSRLAIERGHRTCSKAALRSALTPHRRGIASRQRNLWRHHGKEQTVNNSACGYSRVVLALVECLRALAPLPVPILTIVQRVFCGRRSKKAAAGSFQSPPSGQVSILIIERLLPISSQPGCSQELVGHETDRSVS